LLILFFVGAIMRRWLIRLVIVAVLVGGIAAAIMPLQSWYQQRGRPKYVTATVSRGRVETVVNSTGTIKPVRSVSVGAVASGPISEVSVDFNSRVYRNRWYHPGTVLARIDPLLSQAAVDRDRASLESLIAERDRIAALLEQAEKNKERALALTKINEDYLSKIDFDQYHYTVVTTKAQLKLAKANITQAEATLKNSLTNLDYTKIYSPEDGIVIERKVDKGQTVAASFQTPELFIVAPEMDEHMHVFASVDEADIGLIRSAEEHGRVVKFTIDAYPAELFEGKIYQIRKNSTTTQNVVTYPVVIDAPNPEMKLMPGMTANLSFQIEIRENTLRVPASVLRFVPPSALVRSDDRKHVETQTAATPEVAKKRSASEKAEQARGRQHRVVWVEDGAFLKAVPVTLGLIENQYVEIVEGDLKEGDKVVTGIDSAFTPR
jgi:HlyD family secretion protein